MVTSKEDLVACAPRWGRFLTYNNKDDTEGRIGSCYRVKLNDVIQPRLPTVTENPLLAPFASDNFVTGSWRFDHSQFGFSAHVSKQRDELVVGAVGVFAFDGTVVLPSFRVHWGRTEWRMFSLERITTWQTYSSRESLCVPAKDRYLNIGEFHSGYFGRCELWQQRWEI